MPLACYARTCSKLNDSREVAVPRCLSVIVIEWNRFFDDIDLVILNYHNLSINFSFGRSDLHAHVHVGLGAKTKKTRFTEDSVRHVV